MERLQPTLFMEIQKVVLPIIHKADSQIILAVNMELLQVTNKA